MAATQSSISPSSRHAQNPRSQRCSPSNPSSSIANSPDASFGCRLSSIWKSSSSPAMLHLLFPDMTTYYAPATRKFVPRYVDLTCRVVWLRALAVVFQEIEHDSVELFRSFHVGQVCRAVHDDLAHVR